MTEVTKIAVVDSASHSDVLVCSRVADLARPPLTSVTGHCEECDAQVWVAISSPVEPRRLCLVCAEPLIRAAGSAAITPRQIADIKAYRK